MSECCSIEDFETGLSKPDMPLRVRAPESRLGRLIGATIRVAMRIHSHRSLPARLRHELLEHLESHDRQGPDGPSRNGWQGGRR